MNQRRSVRNILDVLATVALIGAAGAVMWSVFGRPMLSRAGRTQVSVPTEVLRLDGAAVLGSGTSKLVLVEFSDFECPFCSRFAKEVFPQLKAKYVDPGLMQIVFRHNPLERIHKRARPAAVTAECARRQGKFWPTHDRLFLDPARLEASDLLDHAAATGLDMVALAECTKGDAEDRITEDATLARRLGLTSTPAFVFGMPVGDGTVKATDVLTGAKPFSDFALIIERLLTKRR